MKKQMKTLLTTTILGGTLLISLPLLGACGGTKAEETQEQVEQVEQDTLINEVKQAAFDEVIKSFNEPTEQVSAEEEIKPADLEVAPENQVYKIGETVNYRGLELTITKAEFTQPTQYGEPENGKVLTLHVEAVNNTGDKIFVDNTEFSLYDTEGNTLGAYYSYDESPISNAFNSGKKLTGKLFFDVTEGTEYELIYTPTFAFDGETEIVFKIEVQ